MAPLPAALQRWRRGTSDDPRLQSIKKRVIDAAFERRETRSFADLGGVWAVDAGYTFYAIDRHRPHHAVLVDEEITGAVRSRAARRPELRLLERNFGEPDVPADLGEVDCLFLFDVLLHQVQPDWDELLTRFAPLTRDFLIVNPQLVNSDRTVRLLDLGQERYLELVPDLPLHHQIWSRLDGYDAARGRHYRDVHNIWQWGIVDAELKATMTKLGYELVYFENAGLWQGLSNFENHAFIFTRG